MKKSLFKLQRSLSLNFSRNSSFSSSQNRVIFTKTWIHLQVECDWCVAWCLFWGIFGETSLTWSLKNIMAPTHLSTCLIGEKRRHLSFECFDYIRFSRTKKYVHFKNRYRYCLLFFFLFANNDGGYFCVKNLAGSDNYVLTWSVMITSSSTQKTTFSTLVWGFIEPLRFLRSLFPGCVWKKWIFRFPSASFY